METTPRSKLQTSRDTGNPVLQFNAALAQLIRTDNNEAFQNDLKNVEGLRDVRDVKGGSYLHIAVEHGHEKVVKNFIEIAFDVNFQNEFGQTPLMVALEKKHMSVAKILLEANCDIQICDKVGVDALRMVITMNPLSSPYTPLMRWTDKYWEIAGLMLDRLDSDFSDGKKVADKLLQINCPLSHVVFMKNSEVMRIMIEKGCSVNAKDRFTGKTALHWAVKYCKLDRVKILLSYGSDVDVMDRYKRTPLMYIYFRADPRVPPCEVELVNILLEHKTSMYTAGSQELLTELNGIFRCGSKDAIRAALEKDSSLLLHRYNGTLLHVVALNSNIGVEESIKGRGMDVDCRDMNCSTALYYAIRFENDKVAEYLLSKGASIEIANHGGVTPMHLPFIMGYGDILGIEFDELPFTTEGRLKCLKVMLEFGGDPDIRFKDGKTIFEVVLSNKIFASFAEPVLAQLAIKESLGVAISKAIRQQIQSQNQFKSYFNSRVSQLEEAKSISLSQSVSVFELLTRPNKMISQYARNRILVSKLSELIEQLTFDLYYMNILSKRSSKVSRIADLREKSAAIVCQNIGKLYGYNCIVTYKIIDFLSDEDVQYLTSY